MVHGVHDHDTWTLYSLAQLQKFALHDVTYSCLRGIEGVLSL